MKNQITLAKKPKSFSDKEGKVVEYMQLYVVVHTEDGKSIFVPIKCKEDKNYLLMFAEEIK